MGGSGLLQSEYQDWKQGKVSCACKTISCPRVSDKSVGQPQMHPAVTAKFWRSNQAPARQGECGGACLRRTSCMFRKTCNGGGLCCAMTLWHLKIVPCPLLLQEASQNELTHIDRRHPNAQCIGEVKPFGRSRRLKQTRPWKLELSLAREPNSRGPNVTHATYYPKLLQM